MPTKKIIVPIILNRESKYILEYASQLASVSNAKLSCICSLNECKVIGSDEKLDSAKNGANIKLEYVKTINEILNDKKIPYEVIITKDGIFKSLERFILNFTPHLIIIELSDVKDMLQLIDKITTPFILYHNSIAKPSKLIS